MPACLRFELMTDHIHCGIRDGVNCLRFNRPQKKNALTQEMYSALAAAIVAGEQSDAVGAHLFLGSSGTFTAGNDLADFAGLDAVSAPDAPVLAFLEALISARKPLVAAVDGLAVGIGTTLLLHCDLVYASPSASLRTPFVDLGLVPEAASSLLLPSRCGHAVAFELLCLGNALSAERAFAVGLINEIVPAGRLENKAMAAATALARKPRQALLNSRRLLRGDTDLVRARMREEFTLFAEHLRSHEAQQAISAFMNKRPKP